MIEIQEKLMTKKITKKSKLGRQSSLKKQQDILKSAQFLFHKYGFDGVTMDEIAKRAGVVKATLYNKFLDKENLFVEMMKNSILGLEDKVQVEDLIDGKKLEIVLTEIGEKLITFLESDEVRNSQKLMIIQSDRHKKLAHLFLQNGPLRIKKLIADILRKSKARGEIKIDNCDQKASYFMMMLINMNCFEMLMGLSKKRNLEIVKQDVKDAVEFFVKSLK